MGRWEISKIIVPPQLSFAKEWVLLMWLSQSIPCKIVVSALFQYQQPYWNKQNLLWESLALIGPAHYSLAVLLKAVGLWSTLHHSGIGCRAIKHGVIYHQAHYFFSSSRSFSATPVVWPSITFKKSMTWALDSSVCATVWVSLRLRAWQWASDCVQNIILYFRRLRGSGVWWAFKYLLFSWNNA